MTIDKDELIVAEVQDKILSLAHQDDRRSDDAETVQAIIDQHGEDAVLEFIRDTVRGEQDYREAGKQFFDDGEAGAELGVVIARTVYGQSDGGR